MVQRDRIAEKPNFLKLNPEKEKALSKNPLKLRNYSGNCFTVHYTTSINRHDGVWGGFEVFYQKILSRAKLFSIIVKIHY